jgi:hypothetical protein
VGHANLRCFAANLENITPNEKIKEGISLPLFFGRGDKILNFVFARLCKRERELSGANNYQIASNLKSSNR